ncbi:hypothetical protein BC831DRAFT_454592 [Entophlyctis helioformis]|nr:hypothetical protein BC831DRAFT_454592 [Entophlyctis helioformis]
MAPAPAATTAETVQVAARRSKGKEPAHTADTLDAPDGTHRSLRQPSKRARLGASVRSPRSRTPPSHVVDLTSPAAPPQAAGSSSSVSSFSRAPSPPKPPQVLPSIPGAAATRGRALPRQQTIAGRPSRTRRGASVSASVSASSSSSSSNPAGASRVTPGFTHSSHMAPLTITGTTAVRRESPPSRRRGIQHRAERRAGDGPFGGDAGPSSTNQPSGVEDPSSTRPSQTASGASDAANAQLEADEAFARMLQEQEYDAIQPTGMLQSMRLLSSIMDPPARSAPTLFSSRRASSRSSHPRRRNGGSLASYISQSDGGESQDGYDHRHGDSTTGDEHEYDDDDHGDDDNSNDGRANGVSDVDADDMLVDIGFGASDGEEQAFVHDDDSDEDDGYNNDHRDSYGERARMRRSPSLPLAASPPGRGSLMPMGLLDRHSLSAGSSSNAGTAVGARPRTAHTHPYSDSFSLFFQEIERVMSGDGQAGPSGTGRPPSMLQRLSDLRRQRHNHYMAQAHQLLGLGIAGHPGNYVGDDSIDMSYEGLLALSERIGTVGRRGTQKSVIDRLPTSTYGDATLGTTDKDAR